MTRLWSVPKISLHSPCIIIQVGYWYTCRLVMTVLNNWLRPTQKPPAFRPECTAGVVDWSCCWKWKSSLLLFDWPPVLVEHVQQPHARAWKKRMKHLWFFSIILNKFMLSCYFKKNIHKRNSICVEFEKKINDSRQFQVNCRPNRLR